MSTMLTNSRAMVPHKAFEEIQQTSAGAEASAAHLGECFLSASAEKRVFSSGRRAALKRPRKKTKKRPVAQGRTLKRHHFRKKKKSDLPEVQQPTE